MNKDTARISFAGGTLSMPVTTPYEWEVLLEHVHAAVRRHRHVRLEVDQHDCIVTRNGTVPVRHSRAGGNPVIPMVASTDATKSCLGGRK